MIAEYRDRRAVDRWLTSKWRGVVVALTVLSAGAVLAASILEIAKAVA